MDKKKLLIVDDQGVNRAILGKLFETEYQVLQAQNGREAWECIQEERGIQMVLLDIQMPEMTGFELLEKMKQIRRYKNLPVIMITQYGDEENELKALEMGAVDFVRKPFNSEILRCRVAYFVRKYLEESQNDSRLDRLTKVYTRRTFYKEAEKLLKENPEKNYALVHWNVQRFKLVNDLYGMRAGDVVLKQMANLLREKMPQEGIYGRLEGDRFVMCLPAEQLRINSLDFGGQDYFFQEDIAYHIVSEFGLYKVTDRSLPINVMCDRARLALKNIRDHRSENFAWYDDRLRREIMMEQDLEGSMVKALEENQFDILLQPVYDVGTNKRISAEALVRWYHPEKGMIAPNAFIPLFERNGFIVRLDTWVRERVCRLLREWLDAGKTPLPISVNISRVDLFSLNFYDSLIALVEKYAIPPELLKLEITESAYTDAPENLMAEIKKLRAYGFKVMMDDFGSGYSSLNVLKDIPVDILKIDMRFMESLENSTRAASIIASVVRMAKWLNTPVIAEGVETAAQNDFLKSIGCDCIQGYYYDHPMTIEDFENTREVKSFEKDPPRDNLGEEALNALWQSRGEYSQLSDDILGEVSLMELVDDRLEVLRVNETYYSVIGGSPQELEKDIKDSFDRVRYEDRTDLLENCRDAAEDREVKQLTIHQKDDDGKERLLSLRIAYVGRVGGNPIFYFISNDITEAVAEFYKKMYKKDHGAEKKREMHWREERNRIVTKASGMGIFDYDVEADTMSWSLRLPEGSLVEEVTEHYLSTIVTSKTIHPDCHFIYADTLKQAVRRHREGTLEYIADYGAGYHFYRLFYTSVEEEDGNVYRVVGKIVDIQDEKAAEIEQKKAKIYAENYINQTLFAYEFELQDGNFHKIHADAEKAAFFYDSSAYIGKDVDLDLIHPDDLELFFSQINKQAFVECYQQGEGVISFNYRIKARNGKWIPAEMTIIVTNGVGPGSLIGFASIDLAE